MFQLCKNIQTYFSDQIFPELIQIKTVSLFSGHLAVELAVLNFKL